MHRSSSSGQLPSSRRICKHGPKGFFSLRRSFVHSHKSSSQESADATPTAYFVASAESGGGHFSTHQSSDAGNFASHLTKNFGSSFSFSGTLTGGRLGKASECPSMPGNDPWSQSMTGSTPRYFAGRWRMYEEGNHPYVA